MPVAINGSVGANGRNNVDEVKKIQNLLNQIPASEGGPVPQLKVDGLVGPLTIGAISRFQKRQFGWSDGRVDPGQVTIQRLNALTAGPPYDPDSSKHAVCEFPYFTRIDFSKPPLHVRSSQLGVRAPAPAAPLPPPSTPVELAKRDLTTAKAWASAAEALLGTVMIQMFESLPIDPVMYKAIDLHFHVSKLPIFEQYGFMDDIVKKYILMQKIFADPDKYLRDDFSTYAPGHSLATAYAHAPIGDSLQNADKMKIWFRPPYLACVGLKCRTAVLIHECAHSVAGGLHYGYGHPKATGGIAGEPFGNGLWPRKYADLLPSEAYKNADTYSTFAAHAGTGIDIRPGAHDPLS